MKREILFRGKRFDNNEWVKGYVIDIEHKKYIIPCGTKMILIFGTDHIHWDALIEVDPVTVGQLRYENSYGKYFDGDIYYHAGYGYETVSDLCSLQASLLDGTSEDICQIIGNIHDKI